MVTKKQLKKIKSSLPKGYAKILAEHTKKSISTVYAVLAGEINNVEVLEKAIELAQNHAKEKAQFIEKIKSI